MNPNAGRSSPLRRRVVAWSEGDFRAMRNMVHLEQSDLS